MYLRCCGLFIIPYELNEHLLCVIFTFCIQRKKQVVDQPPGHRYSYSSIDTFDRKKKVVQQPPENSYYSYSRRCRSSGSNSSTAHGTRARPVSLCVCLVDQPPDNRYSYGSMLQQKPYCTRL